MSDNVGIHLYPEIDGHHFALSADTVIAGQHFTGTIALIDGQIAVGAQWRGADGRAFTFQELAAHWGILLPDIISQRNLGVSRVFVGYFRGRGLAVSTTLTSGESLDFVTQETGEAAAAYELSMRFDDKGIIHLSALPVLGSMLSENDKLTLRKLAVSYAKTTGFFVGVDAELSLLSQTFSLPSPGREPAAVAPPEAPQGASPETFSGDNVTWITINKNVKMLRIGRIGFSFKDSMLRVYLDAGFDISIFAVNFYGLRIGIPIQGGDVDFGLDGLLFSLDRPALSLSGGLYRVAGQQELLYNGSLAIRFKNICIKALGSYGEVTDKNTRKKEVSLFIYAAVLTPLGGTPSFYITGLSLGFGVNRALVMPSLTDVPKFPLVQMMLGGGKLSPADSPQEALAKLSDHIRPSAGDYFAAVGVKFTTYNIVSSFALLAFEFGNRLRVSLLGQSVVTMPPNLQKQQNPVMYAELALRAVLDFDDGYFEVLAALTNESYVLDKRCRLTGGFVFALWTKDDRAGDFIIALGGCHHPLFAPKAASYPSVEKLGINWAINDNITLKGQGYFAVTPACVMAGCDVSINYSSGNLKAWLNAYASFYMQWKPFHYDVSIGICVGVSYRFTVLWHTVTLWFEVSARLHLWGPDFSGAVTIDLSIISFTVYFGSGRNGTPPPISWSEFKNSFLPASIPAEDGLSYVDDNSSTGVSARVGTIKITNGALAEGMDKDKKTTLASPQELVITTHSAVPASGVYFQGMLYAEETVPGIAPMGINESVSCAMRVSVTGPDDQPVGNLCCAVNRENLSAAIWGNNPSPTSDLVRNQITGVTVTAAPLAPADSQHSYSIENVADRIDAYGSGWLTPDPTETKHNPLSFDADRQGDTSLRNASLLAETFQLSAPKYREGGIFDHAMDYLWSTPITRNIGVKLTNE